MFNRTAFHRMTTLAIAADAVFVDETSDISADFPIGEGHTSAGREGLPVSVPTADQEPVTIELIIWRA